MSTRKDLKVSFGSVEVVEILIHPEPAVQEHQLAVWALNECEEDSAGSAGLELFRARAQERRDKRCVTPRLPSGDSLVLELPGGSALWQRRRQSRDNPVPEAGGAAGVGGVAP
mmetsp:Transcript_113278/g.315406  ORF Transcript_113278/g.315406 Transcript_113278/m.315406 type:complete len:113 (-) Transcript_113278:177-515(-)